MQKEIEELTLLLLYLTSWREDELPDTMRRSWKGHSFDALNTLVEQDYLRGTKSAKSVYLTKEGIEQAKQLMEKYLDSSEADFK